MNNAATTPALNNNLCYERVEMADGVIRMCVCSFEMRNGELRITGIVRVVG